MNATATNEEEDCGSTVSGLEKDTAGKSKSQHLTVQKSPHSPQSRGFCVRQLIKVEAVSTDDWGEARL